MLSVNTTLYFPRLVFVEEVNFKSRSDDNVKTTHVYRLDWDTFDDVMLDKFNKWKANYCKDKNAVYFQSLPSDYEAQVVGLRFAIPSNYLSEIRRNAIVAVGEWGLNRSFDTVIREMCLKPAISHIEVAFKLIADCLYDKDTNYFYRRDDKTIISHMLLYRFWFHQTGRGMVREHSDFEKLGLFVDYTKKNKEKACVEKFLNAINEHEALYQKVARNIVYEECNIK